eukprot:scaffold82227_cov58-Attheya_sp.AAC.1
MAFLHMDNIIEAAEVLINCATTSITTAPPVPSSTPPTAELAEMAASNVAVAGATSNVSVGTVVVVGGTGVVVGASVLMAIILSPVHVVIDMNKPTPSPSPNPTIIPKIQCPDAGAAMFAGYKVSNTYEDMQLLMVTLTDLPERLELFLTNSFSLPTMSEEFAGNKTGSVKMIIPSGGFSAGTLFGYESPTVAISDKFIWQNSAAGFILPEQGSDVLLYCRDDFRMIQIASLSYGMTQEDVPRDLRMFSIAIPYSSCAFYKGEKIGTTDDLIDALGRNESFDTTSCTEPGFDFDRDALNMAFKVIEKNSKPSMQPSVSRSPSLTPMALNEKDLSNIPSTLEFRTKGPEIQARRTRAPVPLHEKDEIMTSQHPTHTMDPMTGPSSFPTMQPSVSRSPSQAPTERNKQLSNPSLHPSNSFDPVSKPSIGPIESISPTTKKSGMPSASASIRPSLKGSLLPTVSPSANSSDLPSRSIGPSIKPSSTPSISLDPFSASSIEPSGNHSIEPSGSLPLPPTTEPSDLLSVSLGPSMWPSMAPTDSVATSKHP